ncbi:ScbA/BarX family gamma-butyrolactone biosynthesis protein [Kitasatospora sp. NPDC088134]|uniref:ScbA/BarX family gamma-butyrolactone biosynthesis protein n=1 Tax=Kitasatospora sp. NPDC088134 TaxID=3364071 RepID=UPI003828CBF0
MKLDTRPRPAPARTTVPAAFVHKSRADEVLLADSRRQAADRFLLGLRWPADHSLYRPAADGSADLVLAVETLRQAGIFLSHQYYGVPLGHQFLLSGFEVEITHPDGLPSGPTAAGLRLEAEVTTTPAKSRFAARIDAVLRDADRVYGRGAISWTAVDPARYEALRRRSRPAAPVAPGAPRPAALPAPVVGRSAAEDVVLAWADPSHGGAWALRIDQRHPVYFDHPLDHVPGMLLFEALRQAGHAAGWPARGPIGVGLTLVGATAEFPAFCELGPAPVLLDVAAIGLGSPCALTGGARAGQEVVVTVRQNGTRVAAATTRWVAAKKPRTPRQVVLGSIPRPRDGRRPLGGGPVRLTADPSADDAFLAPPDFGAPEFGAPESGAPAFGRAAVAAARRAAFADGAGAHARRRLSAPVADALVRAGFARHFVPAWYGGAAGSFADLLRASVEVAEGCPSAGWCGALYAAHGRLAGYLPGRAGQELWGSGPDAVIAAAVTPPRVDAEPVRGGWRLTGAWRPASGVDHAEWILLSARTDPADGPGGRLFAVPLADCAIEDTWQAPGMCGTGSNTVHLDRVPVPAHRTVRRADLLGWYGPPGAARCHRVPYPLVAALIFAGPVLGAARAAVACLRDPDLRPAVGAAECARTHALGDLGLAARLLADAARRADGPDAGRASTVVENARDSALAARLCVTAVDRLLPIDAPGAAAEDRLRRLVADVRTAAGHAMLRPPA